MARETVDFGIDLGTTNSAVAVSTGADATVVRNTYQIEYTPSAVHVSRAGSVRVGLPARKKAEDDPANAHAEFKLQMGMRDVHRDFEASGRRMTPEELSAEVLKSLVHDVDQALEERLSAAVITVPAAFELDQCDATRRAAELAGLCFAPLLQEPTAAAWAYSVAADDVPQRGFWLVYDLGGGTFDAAVIQVEDGEFTVVNHAGDNHLGGKLIDWSLVEDVLIPAARVQCPGVPLDASDTAARATIAKLKLAAEQAKIELSRSEAAEVDLNLHDQHGNGWDFVHEISRADVERAALPVYRKSIGLCRAALAEKGLAPADIERVLLVGGATLAPALRELLADPVEGLGVRLDHRLDPVTVVARGAAVFARTQRVPYDLTSPPADAEHVALEFVHKPTGRTTDPLVGGRAHTADGRDWTGYTIEFVGDAEGQPAWRSGRLPLTADGSFNARLKAYAAENTYTVELCRPDGTRVPTEPDYTTYQWMAVEGGDATLNHSVGVWLEGNGVHWLVAKGAELPAHGRVVLESTVDVCRGERTGLIRVPVVQGERHRADRNVVVGQLDVRPEEVTRDVPAGSEIEVYLEIDESCTPRVDVYVPILDEEFQIEVDLGRGAPDVAALRDQSEAVAGQYRRLRRRASASRAERTTELLDDFDQQGGLDGIRRELDNARVNPDAPATCQELLRKAESALDEAEEALRLPRLVEEAESLRSWVREVVEEHGDAELGRELREAERELDAAVAGADPTLVTHHTEALRGLGLRALDAAGQLPVLRFTSLRDHFAASTDARVQRLLREGEQALAARDTDRLRNVAIDLGRMVRSESAPPAGSLHTTVRRGR